MKEVPKLYIKLGCPWCIEALNFFNGHGIAIEVVDVIASRAAMQQMVALSGQTKTPTFEYGDFVVADFDVNEFLAELEEFPEVKADLGLGPDED
ncbi:MAG: glutaredoxin family protein [Puniceicoccaceae bacterium]